MGEIGPSFDDGLEQVRLGVLRAAEATTAAFDMPQPAVRGIRGLADGGTIESPRIRTTGFSRIRSPETKHQPGFFFGLGCERAITHSSGFVRDDER